MGVTVSLRDGKFSAAYWIILFLMFAERILGTEGEGALGKHWEPCATVVRSQTHGVKYSVGPTLDNVGIQPSTFHVKHYQGKESALK